MVTTSAGSTPPLTYTYVAPTLTTVSPSGPTSGGTSVTLTGTGFIGATGVTFDGVPATGVVVVSDTTITLTTPAGAAGTADVVVVLPGADATKLAGFTYVAGAGAGAGAGGSGGSGGSGDGDDGDDDSGSGGSGDGDESVDDGDGSGSDGGSSDPSSDETSIELGGLPSTGGGRVVLIGLAGLLALTGGGRPADGFGDAPPVLRSR